MTAAQLAHLAELAAFAADFFADTDPAAARKFGDAALRADALSVDLRREEDQAVKGVNPTDAQSRMAYEMTLQ
jgi:hypothetical protein